MTSTDMERIYALVDSTIPPKRYSNIVVAGATWGDEGKGKIVDLLMRSRDIGVRYRGGANAGHTIWTENGIKIATHLLPCAVAQGKHGLIGAGVCFDAEVFLHEIDSLDQNVFGSLKVNVDPRCTLALPYHRALETYLESCRGEKIGTTGRGIVSHALFDRGRVGLRVADLLLTEGEIYDLLDQIDFLMKPIYQALNQVPPDRRELAKDLKLQAESVGPYIADTSTILLDAFYKSSGIVLEGAQAMMLDPIWGSYPYVTSGEASATAGPAFSGLPLRAVDAILLVYKFLLTRVGNGGFPTEMWAGSQDEKVQPELREDGPSRDEYLKSLFENYILSEGKDSIALSKLMQVRGYEFGATTGRPRSVGYPDLQLLSYSVRLNDPTWLAITKMDMADILPTIRVCVGYRYKGSRIPWGELPMNVRELNKVNPIYEDWDGWNEDLSSVRGWNKLPFKASCFLRRIADFTQRPIAMVGVGARRDQVVVPSGWIVEDQALYENGRSRNRSYKY